AVGCAPTAWGQIYGYWEQKGRDTIAGTPASNRVLNNNSRAMIRTLNDRMGTYCTDSGGATNLWDVGKGALWRGPRGLRVATNSRTLGLFGNYDVFKHTRAGLRDNRPTIVVFTDTPNLGGGCHAVATYGYWEARGEWWEGGYQKLEVKTNWAAPTDLTLELWDNSLTLWMSTRISVSSN
ncbi:MAG: hypothetical protein VKQ33_13225, partial [Candidatus Sericytochromatia bacterium]|nr:hypothetical protein [Candidatus Sericytochromatia bacterium]